MPRFAAWAACLLVALPAAAATRRAEPRLLHFYDRWQAEIRDLASERELTAFGGLRTDLDRERFVRAFWSARGDDQLERFARNVRAAHDLGLRSRDERRAVVLAGKPAARSTLAGCAGRERDLVLWEYPAWTAAHHGSRRRAAFTLVFVQTARFDPRTLRLWAPATPGHRHRTDDAVHDELRSQPEVRRCLLRGPGSGSPSSGHLRASLEHAVDFAQLASELGWQIPDPAWLAPFEAPARAGGATRTQTARVVAALAPGTGLESRLVPGVELGIRWLAVGEVGYLEAQLEVPTRLLRLQTADVVLDRLSVIGDLYRAGRLIDTFTVDFLIAGADPATPSVLLPFYRRVRPGAYRLELRAADSTGLALLRAGAELEAPSSMPAGRPILDSRQSLASLTRSEVVVLETFPRLELVDPGPAAVGAAVTIEAIVTGGAVDAVEFVLDGQTLGRDDQPPYETEVALPPGRHHLLATALDRHSRAVATRGLELERPVTAFAVELLFRAGEEQAPVRVVVPERKTLDRLECYWNDRLRTTVQTPPFSCPVPANPQGPVPYVRAVAITSDGEQTEDLLFLGPRGPDEVEVQLVEIFLSVLDSLGRPVLDLGADEVAVEEGGRLQAVESLRSVANLPLNVAVLMDVSSSLGRGVRSAARSAEDFFSQVLREGDLASLLTFGSDVEQVVAFTGDPDALRYGTLGLRAHGSTRLYDALAFAFYTFAGLDGRRALVVLTDGNDTDSDLGFAQVLEQAQLARVTVYPIAFGRVDETTVGELAELAAASGGRLFRVRSVDELDGVYRQIETELRSQYQLIYRPSHTERIRDLDDLEVHVERPGVRVRRLRSGA